MKTGVTFLTALFLTFVTYASFGQGRLNVTSMTDCRLRVIVDGNKYEMSNALFLNNLSGGYHDVKIFEITRGWMSRNRMLYASSILLRPEAQMNITVNRSGEIAVAEQRSDRYGRGYDNSGYDRRYDHDDHDHDGQGGYGRRDDRDVNNRPMNGGNRNAYPQGRGY